MRLDNLSFYTGADEASERLEEGILDLTGSGKRVFGLSEGKSRELKWINTAELLSGKAQKKQ